jgi:hypothetical protein
MELWEEQRNDEVSPVDNGDTTTTSIIARRE